MARANPSVFPTCAILIGAVMDSREHVVPSADAGAISRLPLIEFGRTHCRRFDAFCRINPRGVAAAGMNEKSRLTASATLSAGRFVRIQVIGARLEAA